jgi:hypothetical protein
MDLYIVKCEERWFLHVAKRLNAKVDPGISTLALRVKLTRLEPDSW